MLLGPVFRAELLRTSRRGRFYGLRFFYGLALLLVIWTGYEGETSESSTVTIAKAAEAAYWMFLRFAVVQLILILMLVPALFGGAIADEKQRKTLHYLMASQLSSFEIVVDKMLGKGTYLAVFLALGLPVVCLVGLIGGVGPDYVTMAYVGTVSTALMAVALTVLVSTLTRKVRQAVLISYVLLLAWQFAPAVIMATGTWFYHWIYVWLEPVNTWVGATSPFSVFVLTGMSGGLGKGMTPVIVERFLWMVGLQAAASAALILLAVWRLRPAFRRHEATQPRRKWFGERKARRSTVRRRWWDRPDCGDDAMSWKERYFVRTDIFTKLVVLPATVFVSVFMVMYIGLDESVLMAVKGFLRRGAGGAGGGRRDSPGTDPGGVGVVYRHLAPGAGGGVGVVLDDRA